MKVSELPHLDSAWGYLELKDGSLVALPKDAIEELQAENEKLKAELKKWEDRSKAVKDGYDGEVYEWEDNYYIVTPYLNVFVKGLLKENAKLKCLALHAMSEYFGYKTLSSYKKKMRAKYGQFANKFYFAYRKAKKELREGK